MSKTELDGRKNIIKDLNDKISFIEHEKSQVEIKEVDYYQINELKNII